MDQFPVNMLIASYGNRVCTDETERQHYTELLDRAVRYAVDPLPAFLFRSSLRLDHGDRQGAIDDMRALADRLGTPFAKALASAYAAVPEDGEGSAAFDLDALPAPQSGEEAFLAGYHRMRSLDYAGAAEFLEHPDLDSFPPATTLRLMTLSIVQGWRKLSMEERQPLAQRMVESVIRLEEEMGRTSASTMGLKAAGLLHAFRYSEASDVCDGGITLAPYSFMLLSNKGKALEELGDYGGALAYADQAIALRPKDRAPLINRAMALCMLGRFDEATHTIVEAAESLGERPTSHYLGIVESSRALDAMERQETALAKSSAERALEHFAKSKTQKLILQPQCEAILSGDQNGIYRSILRQLVDSPLSRPKLRQLARSVPEHRTPEDLAAMDAYFVALAKRLEQTGSYAQHPL